MSVTYRAVDWNRQKRRYDLALTGGILLYLLAFVATGLMVRPGTTAETLLIRAFGTAAFLLLHLVLSIGPLARLDRRFLPLLYNRRHLGVATFVLGLAHGAFALVQFHALGDVNPLVGVLSANTRLDSLAHFPFQPLGLAALVVLFLMAATSHDFWLTQITAPWWKRLHMAVYLAYGLLVGHVALGALQAETHPGYAVALGLGVAWLAALHLLAGWRERAADVDLAPHEGWVDACALGELTAERGRIVPVAGERVAVFLADGKVSAISNVCQHQNGPLGEGRVVDACVVCPWHGYEYQLADGRSPPPFTERVPTFNVRIVGDRVWIDPQPNPAGTAVEPVPAAGSPTTGAFDEFYVGYRTSAPPGLARHLKTVVVVLYAMAIASGGALASWQQPFADSVFEYGTVGTYEGHLTIRPYPMLHPLGEQPTQARPILLVALGKRGADSQVADFDGQTVRLRGQRIARGEDQMVELTAEALEVLDAGRSGLPATVDGRWRSLGEVTLRGEIVDSKCHLGVMKPGEGKPHRACAVRCIGGGAPPMLWVRSPSGAEARLLLIGRDGRQLGAELLDRVAEPVAVRGELVESHNLLTLRTEPAEIERIDAD